MRKGRWIATGCCALVLALTVTFDAASTLRPADAAVAAPPLTATALASQISGASRSNSVGTIQPTLKEVLSKPAWRFVGLQQIPPACNPRVTPLIVTNPIPCTFGPASATRTVALVGASHAGMWLSALIAMANQDGFILKSFIYAGCPPVMMDFNSGLIRFDGLVVSAQSCMAWNTNVASQVNALGPDVVIVGGGTEAASSVPATFNQYTSGMSAFISRFSAPTKVILGSTTYRTSTQETARCVNSHISAVTACNALYNGLSANDPTKILLRRDQLVAAQTGAQLVPLISLTCTPSTKAKPVAVCPPVVNHRLVYTDGSHLSDSYVTYVAPVFRSLLSPVLNAS